MPGVLQSLIPVQQWSILSMLFLPFPPISEVGAWLGACTPAGRVCTSAGWACTSAVALAQLGEAAGNTRGFHGQGGLAPGLSVPLLVPGEGWCWLGCPGLQPPLPAGDASDHCCFPCCPFLFHETSPTFPVSTLVHSQQAFLMVSRARNKIGCVAPAPLNSESVVESFQGYAFPIK